MAKINCKWQLLAASVAAASLVGCGGQGGTVPPLVVPPETLDFSTFATRVFSQSANSTPVSVDLNLTFDVNDDPTAFDALIMSGTY
jgi:hypothetical protein